MSTFPRNLIDALRAKESIIFVGAGVSTWSGLPGWEGLLVSMLNYLEDRGIGEGERREVRTVLQQGNLPLAASLGKSLMRKADFVDFVEEMFIAPNWTPHYVHEIITSLGPDCFVTTNYDRLIDVAFEKVHGGLVLRAVNNHQLTEQARIMKYGSSRFIFTPHGRAEHSDTIVLAAEDYRALRTTWSATLKTLEHFLVSRPVVYLGFGLQDLDFLILKDSIAATYEGAEREHFAIMPDVSDLQKRFWREHYGIHIISYDTLVRTENGQSTMVSHESFVALLEDLQRQVTAKEQTSSQADRYPANSSSAFLKKGVVRLCESIINRHSNRSFQRTNITARYRNDLSPVGPDEDYRFYLHNVERRRVPVSSLLASFDHVTLIGSPGSGKTHTVSEFAVTVAEKTLAEVRSQVELRDKDLKHSIPLILPMKEYSGSIKSMISERLPSVVTLEYASKHGMLTLILDAVNEVKRELMGTDAMAADVVSFMEKHPLNKYVLTSRSWNYVSTFSLPVFELNPIHTSDLKHVLDEHEVHGSDLSEDMLNLLSNPLFLGLFLRTKRENVSRISGAADLIHQYLQVSDAALSREVGFIPSSIQQLLAPLAYRAIEAGTQSVSAKQVVDELSRHLSDNQVEANRLAQRIFNALVFLRLLELDEEGQVGLFHQTALEYLAALELGRLYEQEPTILEEKLSYLRWDETIILLVSLLPTDKAADVLKRLVDRDVVLASRAFEAAAFKQREVGPQLFKLIVEGLEYPNLSTEEKRKIAEAVRNLGRYGDKETLLHFLKDETLGSAAASSLAEMDAKEAIPEITERLLGDAVYPSDFGSSLSLLIDTSAIPLLIRKGREADEEKLLVGNIASVLGQLESAELYEHVDELMRSDVARERRFACEILGHVVEYADSEEAKRSLVAMLEDSNPDVRWYAIFGLSRHSETGDLYANARVSEKLWKLLLDQKMGYQAADYLREIADDETLEEAQRRLEIAVDSLERINLCTVLADACPEMVKPILLEELAGSVRQDPDETFGDAMREAFSALGREHVMPELLGYFDLNDPGFSELLFDVLSWLYLGPEEQYPVTPEQFSIMLSLWEKHGIGTYVLSKATHSVSKPILLSRINDSSYAYREDLISVVVQLPLNMNDLDLGTIDWLLTRISVSSTPAMGWYPAARIVGSVSNEAVVHEKLLPLLGSSSDDVRSATLQAISFAERTLGKRFHGSGVEEV